MVKKQAALPFSKLTSSDLRNILVTNIFINIGILFAIPDHFSFIAISLLITSLLALRVKKKAMETKAFRIGTGLGLLMSLMLASLAYYWISKGDQGCAAFFGEQVPCFSHENMQFSLLELFFTPVVLLFVYKPLIIRDKSSI